MHGVDTGLTWAELVRGRDAHTAGVDEAGGVDAVDARTLVPSAQAFAGVIGELSEMRCKE